MKDLTGRIREPKYYSVDYDRVDLAPGEVCVISPDGDKYIVPKGYEPAYTVDGDVVVQPKGSSRNLAIDCMVIADGDKGTFQ